jgi:hypothetical protein
MQSPLPFALITTAPIATPASGVGLEGALLRGATKESPRDIPDFHYPQP